MSCIFCGGGGCAKCKGSGWIEIMGAGMVHPRVLQGVAIDPEEYTGFAFGLGIDRVALAQVRVPGPAPALRRRRAVPAAVRGARVKFSLDWLGDFVDVEAAGGADGVRRPARPGGHPDRVDRRGRGGDTILDAEITPNRPDAMGHRGLAREIAAMAGHAHARLRRRATPSRRPRASRPSSSPRSSSRSPGSAAASARAWSAASRNGPAGELVRRRLAAIGAKSISAAVDATNYVLWDTGQPLHAFDFDKLAGGVLIVRKAARGEKLVTLDGVERTLDPSDVVVADGERAVSLAGIMGGLDTAVTAQTKNVLLEAAWWDPVTVRRTARRLGHAHGRLAPLRAGRRPRRDPRSAGAGGAAARRGGAAGPSRRVCSTRTAR